MLRSIHKVYRFFDTVLSVLCFGVDLTWCLVSLSNSVHLPTQTEHILCERIAFIYSFIHSYNTFYFIWSFSFPVLVIVHNAFHSYISQWDSHQSIFNFFLWAWTNEHYKMCIWIFFSALAFTLYSRWRYFEFLRLILISCICAMKRSIVMFGEVY